MNRNLRVGLPAVALVLAVVAVALYMLSAAAERAAGEAHELRFGRICWRMSCGSRRMI